MKSTITFQNQSVVELRQGTSRALIAPQHGARLLSWEANGHPIIYWPEQADWSKPAKVRGGNPVLFPFLGRHFVDGTIEKWRDQQGTVRTMPMHGFSREIAFEVIPSADDVLQMRLQESAASLEYYPFRFQFDVIYRLSPNSLEVEFAVTNTGSQPLPYYAGHHFYFAIPRQERALWELETPFVRTGRQNPDGSVTEQNYSSPTARLDQPELVDRYLIGPTKPSFSLRRSTDHRTLQFKLDVPGSVPWYAVTTWTEKPESDFYCVEPWLGLPNAIHHELGLRWVQPGQTERSICLIKDSVS